MPLPYNEMLRDIMEREADFLTRQLNTRCDCDKDKIVAEFEARIRVATLSILEQAGNLNMTYPNVRLGGGVL